MGHRELIRVIESWLTRQLNPTNSTACTRLFSSTSDALPLSRRCAFMLLELASCTFLATKQTTKRNNNKTKNIYTLAKLHALSIHVWYNSFKCHVLWWYLTYSVLTCYNTSWIMVSTSVRSGYIWSPNSINYTRSLMRACSQKVWKSMIALYML